MCYLESELRTGCPKVLALAGVGKGVEYKKEARFRRVKNRPSLKLETERQEQKAQSGRVGPSIGSLSPCFVWSPRHTPHR